MNRDYLPHALLIRKAYDNGIRVDDHSFAISDNGLMIAIAGTANIENVLEDIDIAPKPFCGHSVHGGCADAFEELDEAIRPHILKSWTVIQGIFNALVQTVTQSRVIPVGQPDNSKNDTAG